MHRISPCRCLSRSLIVFPTLQYVDTFIYTDVKSRVFINKLRLLLLFLSKIHEEDLLEIFDDYMTHKKLFLFLNRQNFTLQIFKLCLFQSMTKPIYFKLNIYFKNIETKKSNKIINLKLL